MIQHSDKTGDQAVADEALIGAYLDGVADEDEMLQLQTRLQASGDTVARFLAVARLDRNLDFVLRRDRLPVRGAAVGVKRLRVWPLAATGVCAVAAMLTLFLRTGSDSSGKHALPSLTDHAPSPAPTSARQALESRHPDETIGFPGHRVAVDGLVGAPPGAVKTESLFRFDFEREAAGYPQWMSGTVKDCPPDSGRHRCLAGEHFKSHPEQVGVTLGDWRRVVMAYTADLFITFDYWIGETTGRDPDVEVLLQRDNGHAFRMDLATHVRGRWAHVTLPLSALRRWHDPGEALRDGDLITAVHLTMPSRADDVFLVDNVEIARYAPTR